MTASLRNQLLWCTTGLNANPLEYFNIFRPLVHLFNSWKMNRYLVRELDTRYTSLQVNGSDKNRLGKSVIDLALAAYLDETPSATGINSTFKDFAIGQIKLFVFAGHDTTSAAAVFTYHLLSQNPAVLAKVREEHNHIFGADTSSVGDLISSNPALLNRLVFTLAVIKESLRIYPTVAALRDGQVGFSLQDDSGQRFPTENCLVWGDHYAVHRNPHIWPRAEEFLPERWMVSEGHSLYPPKNAWRPFEKGPRNCIGLPLRNPLNIYYKSRQRKQHYQLLLQHLWFPPLPHFRWISWYHGHQSWMYGCCGCCYDLCPAD
jgi:cytochrome P450